jgi:methionyl-tRNA synthetase
VRSTNKMFQMSKPWDKVLEFAPGEPGEEVDRIVYQAAEGLRIVGILLQPYMPGKAKMLLDQLGVDESRRSFDYCKPGADLEYGTPIIELGGKHQGVLFPPLPSEE